MLVNIQITQTIYLSVEIILHYQAFHTCYPDTDLVVYSSFPPEWAAGEAEEPVAIFLKQYLT
jgi:hypothetical protein